MLHRALLALCLVLIAGRPLLAACGDEPGDAAATAAAQMAIDTACPCGAATSHGSYVACARDTLASQSGLRPECYAALKRCAARSVCGRPGAVTCCRTRPSGDTRCSIKRDASRCTTPAGWSACIGARTSCCDACVAGGCAPPPTTTTTLPLYTCAAGPSPACGGTCPPGEICEDHPFSNECECFPDGSQPCGESRSPYCNGTCPAGQRCGALRLFGPCGCVPEGTTACGETFSCGAGSCPPGDECGAVSTPTVFYCACAPAGVPCCEGGLTCPAGHVCAVAPNICFCLPSP